MIYTRDLAAGYSIYHLAATHDHVRDHLAGVADPDDNPETRAGEVAIRYEELPPRK